MESRVLSWLWTSGALDELHRLLWTKPQNNSDEWDPGWSCREHAVVVAGLLALRGVHSDIRHGWCMFVNGSDNGQPPVAVGQQPPLRRIGHSWDYVNELGDVDFSPRFDQGRWPWRPLRSIGIVGGAWEVRGMADTAVIVCSDIFTYEQEIARATHLVSAARALYLVSEQTPFEPSMLHVDFVNSPLTDRIRADGGDYIYAKLVVYLHDLAAGRRRKLPGNDEKKWWRLISRIDDGDVAELFATLARPVT